jgi:hypothetical protein
MENQFYASYRVCPLTSSSSQLTWMVLVVSFSVVVPNVDKKELFAAL